MPLPGVTPPVVATPTPTPTFTPTPSPVLTPTPAPLTYAPNGLTLTQTGAATFTVTETGYRGQYAVASNTTAVATVTSPVASSSDTTQITLNVLAAGTATITVTDASGQSVAEVVGVTLLPVTVQNTGARR